MKQENRKYAKLLALLMLICFFVGNLLLGYPATQELSLESLKHLGAVSRECIFPEILTSLFLHLNIEHLFTNVILFVMTAGYLEEENSSAIVMSIFLIAGVGANLVSIGFYPNTIFSGASSGIFGLLGYSFVQLLNVYDIRSSRDFSTISLIIIVNFLGTLRNAQVNVLGHAAGLIFGVLIGAISESIKMWRRDYANKT